MRIAGICASFWLRLSHGGLVIVVESGFFDGRQASGKIDSEVAGPGGDVLKFVPPHRLRANVVGQAPGFAAAVTGALRLIAPVMPEIRVSALGTEPVVDGCLAVGAELAWAQLTDALPAASSMDGQRFMAAKTAASAATTPEPARPAGNS